MTEIQTLTASCPSCGATMAGDQRYCLRCGDRRGAPRVTYVRETAPAPPPPAAAPPARRSATPVWVAAVGVLMLAMGVGVLIGASGRDDAAPAAAPVTVTVPTGAPVAATPTPTATAEEKRPANASGKGGKAKHRAKAPAKPVATASQQQLQDLQNLSPDDYNKQSKALPDSVGTSGTPVPKDDKAAGGGSGFETIG